MAFLQYSGAKIAVGKKLGLGFSSNVWNEKVATSGPMMNEYIINICFLEAIDNISASPLAFVILRTWEFFDVFKKIFKKC